MQDVAVQYTKQLVLVFMLPFSVKLHFHLFLAQRFVFFNWQRSRKVYWMTCKCTQIQQYTCFWTWESRNCHQQYFLAIFSWKNNYSKYKNITKLLQYGSHAGLPLPSKYDYKSNLFLSMLSCLCNAYCRLDHSFIS